MNRNEKKYFLTRLVEELADESGRYSPSGLWLITQLTKEWNFTINIRGQVCETNEMQQMPK